jgi:glycosyltransferase involved in cell wall biosynthesis
VSIVESANLINQLASIVISCSEDPGIFDTIDSIEENVEIIATITPCEEIERALRERGIKYVITPKGNHSVTVNSGIEAARHNKIILMDSDCVFEKGAIRSISTALDVFSVVTVNVVFEDEGSIISKQTASCRNFDYTVGFPGYSTHGLPIFRPGLSFHKKIIGDIQYFFDPQILWTEDAELTYRIQKAGVPVQRLSCSVFHKPTIFFSTLLSYYNYGMGDALRVKYLDQKYHSSLFHQIFERYITAFKTQSILLLPFLAVLDLVYIYGYVRSNKKLNVNFKGIL